MRGMADIRQMHRDIPKILKNKSRKCHEYVDDFLGEISYLIEKLEICSYHMIWECIGEKVPENFSGGENYILRDVTNKQYRNAPIGKNDFFHYPRDKYLPMQLSKKEFGKKFIDYFKNGTLAKVFEIPLKSGYAYFNLPVFSEDEEMPRWIVTLIFREDDIESISGEDFFDFMEHLAQQVGMAWDKFQESTAAKLLEDMEYKPGGEDKAKSHSPLDQLKIISRILAREIQVDWCAFFLVNEEENTLGLEAGNVDLDFSLQYSLTDRSDIMVHCFNGNEIIRLCGRERLEEIVKPEAMKPVEKGIRKEKKKNKLEEGKRHFTPYILFEHALFFPIAFGTRKLGVVTLFRARRVQEPQPLDRFEYTTRPFSEFETHLLKKVQRYVFDIFVSHDAVQQRIMDIRNIVSQVISPISAAISSTDKPTPGDTTREDVPTDMSEKLHYVNALSRIAGLYVTNFEKLLDIDTHPLELRMEKIPDLRKYLIHFARLYTPLIRPKCIHLNVTRQTPSDISLEVDRELFDLVIANIIDNAIKYSFTPEDRLRHDLQPKPKTTEDVENVLLSAEKNQNSITITVSSYGIELTEEEKRNIFNREYRGSQAPDRAKGTGIGLYLTSEIIHMHGGAIELVPNTPAHNTVFKITLPTRGAALPGRKGRGLSSSHRENPGERRV
jgi:hypothetical protein